MRDTVLEQYLAKMGFLRDDYLMSDKVPHGILSLIFYTHLV